MARSAPQIGADMLPEEHDAFCAYADSLHLKGSALANLLIARELRLGRLPRLLPRFKKAVPKVGSRRITAHQGLTGIKDAFRDHAVAAGLKMGPAAAAIFRAELAERWLDRAMMKQESS